MQFRRIVTGHDPAGKSTFVDQLPETRVAEFVHQPGLAIARLWNTAPSPSVPATGGDPVRPDASMVPQPGATELLVVQFPPDSVITAETNFAALGAEYFQNFPGLAETFEPENPGMHTTNTVDYGIIMSGELWLELDHGAVRQVGPGDVVIQNGTRHAWRNRSAAPAMVVFVLIGARRT